MEYNKESKLKNKLICIMVIQIFAMLTLKVKHQHKHHILYTFVWVLVLYSFWCALGYYNQVKLEYVKYQIVSNISRLKVPAPNSIGHTNKIVQIRQYSSYLSVQALYKGVGLKTALEMGLQDISSYLLGNNASGEKLEMAYPMSFQRIPTQNAYIVSFAMPSYYNITELPTPINKRLMIKVVGPKTMASLRWRGGIPSGEQMEHKRKKLQKYLQDSNYNIIGNIVLFQYDSPYTPGWLRRNEALLELQPPQVLV